MKKTKKLLSVFLVALMLISTIATIISNAETAITYGGMEVEVINDFTEFELKYGYYPHESSHTFSTKASRATHYGQVLQVNGGSTIKYSVADGAPINGFYLIQYEDSETLNGSSCKSANGWHTGDVTLSADTKYVMLNLRLTTTSLTEEQIEAIISSFVLYDETTKDEQDAKLAEFREKHSAVLKWEFAEGENPAELCTAAKADYAALGSYERSLLSDEEKANIENIDFYLKANEYRTEHKTVLELDLSGEVEEHIDAMIAAINGYDALDDSIKSFLTEAEINQIEKMRNDVALPYFINKFKANHADALALTVETATADDEEKVNAAIAEYAASYPIVKAALAEQISLLSTLQHHIAVEIKLGGWNGTDDFSDPEKTKLLWEKSSVATVTTDLYENVTDGTLAVPKGSTSKAEYVLNDGVIELGDKPLQITIDGQVSGDNMVVTLFGETGPYVRNADEGAGKGRVYIYSGGGDWQITGTARPTDVYYGYTSGMDPLDTTFTVDYDWTNWDSNKVKITVNNGFRSFSATLEYKGTAENKPTDFNVGLGGSSNARVNLDSFQVTTIGDLKHPIAEDGSLLADGEKILLDLNFDFLNPAKYIEFKEYSIVKYGIVAAAGKPADIKADAELLLDGDTSNDPAKYTVLETKMYDGDFIPDNYFVTVTNSSGDNIGKRVSAIAYVVYEKDGEETIAYSRECFYASPIGLLKKEFIENILPANTDGGVIVTDSALETALNNYNTANSSNATLDTILEAVNTTEETTAEQKDLLIDLYLSIGE